MPFTTKDIVKKHILDHHLGSTQIENESVKLVGTQYSQLERTMIVEDSEKVKTKKQGEPTKESVSFVSSDTFDLEHSELVFDSVVVAKDNSLGQIYVEGVDYHVNYDIGSIKRLASGSIPQASEAVIWYMYYNIYERGADYDMDYQKGTIKRRLSGSIESEQWVLIDYTCQFGGLDDQIMENAIAEANDRVLNFIDEIYYQSNHPSLVVGETYLAVSIICRIKAMEDMSKAGGSDARLWTVLSDAYKKEAYDILRDFSGTLGCLKSPQKA